MTAFQVIEATEKGKENRMEKLRPGRTGRVGLAIAALMAAALHLVGPHPASLFSKDVSRLKAFKINSLCRAAWHGSQVVASPGTQSTVGSWPGWLPHQEMDDAPSGSGLEEALERT